MIKITLRTAMDSLDWDKFCAVTGLNPRCLNDGADENMVIVLDDEQAQDLGLPPEVEDQPSYDDLIKTTGIPRGAQLRKENKELKGLT